ncbi:MAG: DUF4278 domain-containing protein [Nostocales cyanobacterium 94392]|nr:DUF4278 domain-containing protein [Nostocales cyanobacterium 94392]
MLSGILSENTAAPIALLAFDREGEKLYESQEVTIDQDLQRLLVNKLELTKPFPRKPSPPPPPIFLKRTNAIIIRDRTMQLTYRGVTYKRNHSRVETSETNIFAVYRDVPYCVRRFISSRNEQLNKNLIYRGIPYFTN